MEQSEWRNCLQKDLTCIIDSKGTRGAVYVSSLPTAQALPILESAGIVSVLSMAKGVRLSMVAPALRAHLILPAEDYDNYDISQYFQQTFHFIENGRKHGNVLVHCLTGTGRSPVIVAAYLMKSEDLFAEEALSRVKQRRKQTNPNKGFIEQLKKFEAGLLASNQRVCKTQVQSRQLSPQLHVEKLYNGGSLFQFKQNKFQGPRMVESTVLNRHPNQDRGKGSIQMYRCATEYSTGKSKSRTLEKIERLKTSMVVQMVNSKVQGSANFGKLLQRNIYRNKQRLR